MALSGRAGAKPEPRVAVRLVALRKPPEATKKSLDKVVAVAERCSPALPAAAAPRPTSRPNGRS